MAARFSYQVCQQQFNRITFVNGVWIGTLPLSPDFAGIYESCPESWDYLAAAGKDGWELVAVLPAGSGENVYQVLYLKRAG
jgi:hypothetical protein